MRMRAGGLYFTIIVSAALLLAASAISSRLCEFICSPHPASNQQETAHTLFEILIPHAIAAENSADKIDQLPPTALASLAPTEQLEAENSKPVALLGLALVTIVLLACVAGLDSLKTLAFVSAGIWAVSSSLGYFSQSGMSPGPCLLLLLLPLTIILIVCRCGLSREALAAAAGCIAGLITVLITSEIFIRLAPLSGMVSEPSHLARSVFLIRKPDFYQGILAGSMLLSSAGAALVSALLIARTAGSIMRDHSELSARELYEMLISTRKLVIGKIAIILSLSLSGTVLPLLLLFAPGLPEPDILTRLFNHESMVVFIASLLIGLIGLSISAFATQLFCSYTIPISSK